MPSRLRGAVTYNRSTMGGSAGIRVIGGGLAGCEAAWQLASRGVAVELVEMRPLVGTAAHATSGLAELVCSNSLRSNALDRAQGILKEEMRRLGSLIISCADECAVPAGSALAVDRVRFSSRVESKLLALETVHLVRAEAREVCGDGVTTIVATGPMTSPAMSEAIRAVVGRGFLHFYDAVSPIVSAESVDRSVAFEAARHGKGEATYLNCPLSKEEYERFVAELTAAAVSPTREIAPGAFFEGCLPVEEIARRHPDALRHGPLRPVGLTDPRTGRWPYAVVQLRPENAAGTLYNLVGCQTGLRWGEQERVFRMVPGLTEAEFLRYGVMHRNVFIESPALLDPFCRLVTDPRIAFAGQITGVEGYCESALSGLYVGLNSFRVAEGLDPVRLPECSVSGALLSHVTSARSGEFQPMNANFGLVPPVEGVAKRDRRAAMARRALEAIDEFARSVGCGGAG